MLKEESIKSKIIRFLQERRRWVSGLELERSMQDHKPSTISRIARMLADDGMIETKYTKSSGYKNIGFVNYRLTHIYAK